MGGMFSVVKVREGLDRNDYKDPGWFTHPQGTVAYEIEGPAADPVRRSDKSSSGRPAAEVTVVKPGSKASPKSTHQH
jgi:hypothetical protein